MRPAPAFAAISIAIFATGSGWAQAVDISRWNVERNANWDFTVALPPGWTILDMTMGGLRLAIRQNLSGGRKLMCQVNANPQPDTVGLSQRQINDSLQKGTAVNAGSWCCNERFGLPVDDLFERISVGKRLPSVRLRRPGRDSVDDRPSRTADPLRIDLRAR